MSLQEIKTDRKRLLELREEDTTLDWGIRKAVTESNQTGALRDHDYRDTWDIIHPKSGEPFKANSKWFKSFGTNVEKKRMDKRRDEIKQAIHADERKRRKEIDKEIAGFYEKYYHLCADLGNSVSEEPRYDGENDFADILLVAQRVMERDNNRAKCFMDGNALCIVGNNFIDIQASVTMFIEMKPKQIRQFEKILREG